MYYCHNCKYHQENFDEFDTCDCNYELEHYNEIINMSNRHYKSCRNYVNDDWKLKFCDKFEER